VIGIPSDSDRHHPGNAIGISSERRSASLGITQLIAAAIKVMLLLSRQVGFNGCILGERYR
jgi:hypothetical protein